jgi:hypothetical protein
MAENNENQIDLVFRIIDSAINIKVARTRSTDVIFKKAFSFKPTLTFTIALGSVRKHAFVLLGSLVSNLLLSLSSYLRIFDGLYWSSPPEHSKITKSC